MPEKMPDLSQYREDVEIITKMVRAGLYEGVLPALLRIIDRRIAERLKDAEPMTG